MKLLGDFFVLDGISIAEHGFIATINLNGSHIIYTGHFPGFPVTPGVVQMQMVHELLESYLERKLKLMEMPQCKFVKILNPNETVSMNIYVEFIKKGEFLQVKAWGKSNSSIFFKLNSIFAFQ